MIERISQRLFAATPVDTLYHYTSLSGLLGIIGGRHLRASDVRFMNDATELRHTLDLLHTHLEHAWIGPTANHELSMMSLQQYLSSQHCLPNSGIDYCQIPYRQR